MSSLKYSIVVGGEERRRKWCDDSDQLCRSLPRRRKKNVLAGPPSCWQWPSLLFLGRGTKPMGRGGNTLSSTLMWKLPATWCDSETTRYRRKI